MVVYYTGTGNSRYVAQRFAAALGDDLITANEYIKNDTPAALHSDRPWVFVSPTYGWQIPHIFADFLRRGSFTGSREAYFVMTCGSEIGNAGSRIAALCADIGFDYQGVLEVVMPENYVAMFYVPGAEESAQIIAAAQPSIDRGIACVQRAVSRAEGQPHRPLQDPPGERHLLQVLRQVRAVHGLGRVHRLRQVRAELPGQRHQHRRAKAALERRVHALHGLYLRLPGQRHRVRTQESGQAALSVPGI